MKKIMFVDDEIKLLRILSAFFQKKGYTVYIAADGKEARKKMAEHEIDVVFLDLKLPDATGLELLEECSPLYQQKIFVIMTAYGDIESAVTAMKAGAFDYIVKPAKMDEIELVIEKANAWLEMKRENSNLKERLRQAESHTGLIGASSEMKRIFQLVERVADTDATVLLGGESGTGKSMVAHMIHRLSDRNEGPFISVNCAAIPEQLLESELFGYEKGAFTGAHTRRQGKFEAADGGTIFLDEVGEIPLTLQAKLLQVVQEKSFMRLGSNTLQKVDVRMISATNRDLRKRVDDGEFREDLYYRLNIVDIHIPPLREHKDDIPPLIEEFLNQYRQKQQKTYHISEQLMDLLMHYDWPGNVRELQNAIERAVVLCRGNELMLEDFPREIRSFVSIRPASHQTAKTLPEHLEEMEKHLILSALEASQGNAAEAAKQLGISRQLLSYKLNKYSIQED